MITWDGAGERFPRLYAAASLKRRRRRQGRPHGGGFPRLYAAASLKQAEHSTAIDPHGGVFRGFMPRPH